MRRAVPTNMNCPVNDLFGSLAEVSTRHMEDHNRRSAEALFEIGGFRFCPAATFSIVQLNSRSCP